MQEVEKHSSENVNVMVLANKSDLDEVEVTDADMAKFEEERGIKIVKASAKTGQNVDESFLDMTKKLIIKQNQEGTQDKPKTGLRSMKKDFGPAGGNAAGGCC